MLVDVRSDNAAREPAAPLPPHAPTAAVGPTDSTFGRCFPQSQSSTVQGVFLCNYNLATLRSFLYDSSPFLGEGILVAVEGPALAFLQIIYPTLTIAFHRTTRFRPGRLEASNLRLDRRIVMATQNVIT